MIVNTLLAFQLYVHLPASKQITCNKINRYIKNSLDMLHFEVFNDNWLKSKSWLRLFIQFVYIYSGNRSLYTDTFS